MTFTEIGALIGALTGAFTVLDRFASGRPFVWLKRGDYPQQRVLSCFSSSKHDLLITNIRTWPAGRGVRVAYDRSIEAIYDAVSADNAGPSGFPPRRRAARSRPDRSCAV